MPKISVFQSSAFHFLASFQFAWLCLLGFLLVGVDLLYPLPIEIFVIFSLAFLLASVGFWLFAQKKQTLLWQGLSFFFQAIFLMIYGQGGTLSPLHGLLFACALLPGYFFFFQEKRKISTAAFFFLGGILLIDELFLCLKNQPDEWIAILMGIDVLLLGLPWFLKKQEPGKSAKHEQFKTFLQNLQEKALAYRLKSSSSLLLEEHITRTQSALTLIAQVEQFTLELLYQATHADQCVLFWRYGNTLKLQTQFGAQTQFLLSEIPLEAGGIVGTLQKSESFLNLSSIRSNHLPYYAAPFKAQGAFLGIPLFIESTCYGFLALERWVSDDQQMPAAFTAEEEQQGKKAAAQIISYLKAEQLFAQAERSLDAQSNLYQASTLLNSALTPEQVHQAIFKAALQICSFDIGALTHFNEEKQVHQIVALTDEQGVLLAQSDWIGHEFPSNAGLVATALKNRVMLPGPLVSYQPDMLVFDEHFQFQGIRSLLVIPLLYMEKPMGAWILASQQEQAFEKFQRKIIGVLANHVAISLENARRYQAMEAMATIDGLTQLLNRRTWQERFPELIERAERHKQPLTVLLTDIDYFKKINDTHGHPAGDAVLKQVAQVVQSCVRKVDLAARYGGEEFVVVLDGADTANAFQLAEHVRKEVERLELTSNQGLFHCTLSIGMATFPQDGKDSTLLLSRADQALYQAKHQGRNQTVAYEPAIRALAE